MDVLVAHIGDILHVLVTHGQKPRHTQRERTSNGSKTRDYGSIVNARHKIEGLTYQ